MRWILYVTLALGVVWGSYWVVGSRAIEGEVTAWFDTAVGQGIEASQTAVSVSGFPNRFDLTVTDPHLADPISGWGWQGPFAQVLAMTWKPWHVIAVLPHEQQIIAPGQKIDLGSLKLEASLRLVPSGDLALADLIVEGHDLLAKSDLGWQLGAKSVVAAIAQNGALQHLGLEVADLSPDPALAALVPDLGGTISVVHLDATVSLTAPLDRHVAESKPKVSKIDLADFHLTWGTLGIAAKGQVAPDAQGLAEGKIDIEFKNWRSIPALLVAMGLVQPGMGASITGGLEAMAKTGNDPEVLSLALVFAGGRMNFGPLPLGPAPALN